MQEGTKNLLVWIVGCLIIFLAAASQPYFEARAFNKFRKEGEVKATYFDAVFSSLRIQSN